jgi:hypothetical protein
MVVAVVVKCGVVDDFIFFVISLAIVVVVVVVVVIVVVVVVVAVVAFVFISFVVVDVSVRSICFPVASSLFLKFNSSIFLSE